MKKFTYNPEDYTRFRLDHFYFQSMGPSLKSKKRGRYLIIFYNILKRWNLIYTKILDERRMIKKR